MPVRGLKNSALGRQFRILFMGRNEFSCLVLEELFKARGMSGWRDEGFTRTLFPQTD